MPAEVLYVVSRRGRIEEGCREAELLRDDVSAGQGLDDGFDGESPGKKISKPRMAVRAVRTRPPTMSGYSRNLLVRLTGWASLSETAILGEKNPQSDSTAEAPEERRNHAAAFRAI